MKLVKVCQERLACAEQRIEIITRNSAGKPVVKEFEPRRPRRHARNAKENPKMTMSDSSETTEEKIRLLDGIHSPADVKALPEESLAAARAGSAR